MALSRATIQFNFEKSIHQAEELETIANNLIMLTTSNFAGAMQNVAVNWKGENASAYLEKGIQLQDKMEVSAKSLNDIAGTIRAIAKRIYNAEMEALAIAETRLYSKK